MLTAQWMWQRGKRPACPPLPSQTPLQVRARQGLSCTTAQWLQHSPALILEPGNADCQSQAPPHLLPMSPRWVQEMGTLWNYKGHAGLTPSHPFQHGSPGKQMSTALSENRHLYLSWVGGSYTGSQGRGHRGQTQMELCLFSPCIQVNPSVF